MPISRRILLSSTLATPEQPETPVVDARHRFLYHVQGNGRVSHCCASVGKAGNIWSGEAVIKCSSTS